MAAARRSPDPKPPVRNGTQPEAPEPVATRRKSTDRTRVGDARSSFRGRSPNSEVCSRVPSASRVYRAAAPAPKHRPRRIVWLVKRRPRPVWLPGWPGQMRKGRCGTSVRIVLCDWAPAPRVAWAVRVKTRVICVTSRVAPPDATERSSVTGPATAPIAPSWARRCAVGIEAMAGVLTTKGNFEIVLRRCVMSPNLRLAVRVLFGFFGFQYAEVELYDNSSSFRSACSNFARAFATFLSWWTRGFVKVAFRLVCGSQFEQVCIRLRWFQVSQFEQGGVSHCLIRARVVIFGTHANRI